MYVYSNTCRKDRPVLLCMWKVVNTARRSDAWSVGDFLVIELGGALHHDPITVAHIPHRIVL
jgi:hypothetical protein